MPLVNGDFSEGVGGYPDIWGFTTSTSAVDFMSFSETGNPVGYEGFLNSWEVDGLDLITAFSGLYIDLMPATYTDALLTYEGFEKGWIAYTLYTILTRELAIFDSGGVPEQYEDFEEEWGDFWYTMPATTVAEFDSALTPEDFEDFEDGFAGGATQTLVLTFTGTYAVFDGADYEDFEDTAGWPALTL
jgi:hypothetical protein